MKIIKNGIFTTSWLVWNDELDINTLMFIHLYVYNVSES